MSLSAALFALSLHTSMQVVPAEDEPFIPWEISSAQDHSLLQVREKASGLLSDSAAFSRLGEEWLHGSGEIDFWTKVRMVQATRNPARKSRGIHYFFCTVYYTPYEKAFRKDMGYESTQITKSGLGGRKYASSFLRTSRLEGFGKLAKPVKGKPYIKFDGRWGYATRILGNRNNTLQPRLSAAMHRRHPLFRKNTHLTILDPQLYNVFGSIEWRCDDTGFGLHISQIDLYWGEDYPMGPGPNVSRPAGTRFQKSWIVPVLLEQ